MTGLSLAGVTVPGRGRPRLSDVDLSIAPGELVTLVGPNGSGKSTMLGLWLGHVRGDGKVGVGGRERLTALERAAQVAWLPQEPVLEVGLTAVEVVAAARFRFNESRRARRERARAALGQVGAGDLYDRTMETLSGGEAQRVRLATLVAQEAGAWLLDEPTNHLDPAQQLSLLDTIATAPVTVVWVTHDVGLLPHLRRPDARVVGLDAGCVAFDLELSDPSLPDAIGGLFDLSLQAVTVDGETRWVTVGPS